MIPVRYRILKSNVLQLACKIILNKHFFNVLILNFMQLLNKRILICCGYILCMCTPKIVFFLKQFKRTYFYQTSHIANKL